MDDKFLNPYDPKKYEDPLYQRWQAGGFFKPETALKTGLAKKDSPVFSMVLPPPNVTGNLHVGHAAMLAIEDIMTRFHRMRGFRTLWIPGTDHAAIATQSKVEKEIQKKEGRNRHDLGREAFVTEVEKFAKESHDKIVHQVKKMGSSLDWDREAFTLDARREVAVRTAFKRMYEDGLIYRGERIVNWDPRGQTTVSDDEIEYTDEKTKFYYFKYGPFTIGTARPETKFGDKYVVMHPEDKRYAIYKHGQKIDLEWINGPITATVIKDDSINMEFGSGVMTITPWHSNIDFEIAERHGLDKEQIIDTRGKLLPIAGEFAGLKIGDAREKIVEKLKNKGLLEKVDNNYEHRIAHSYRSGGVIEPQIMRQWFVNVNKEFTLADSKIEGIKSGQTVTLKKLMRQAVESGQVKIIPDRFEKVYFNWIDNLRDWCISRQIWYGHRIPVWYQRDLGTEKQAAHFNKSTFYKKIGIASEKEWFKKTIEWNDDDYADSSETIQIGIKMIQNLKERGLIDDSWIGRNRKDKHVRDSEIYVGIEAPKDKSWYQDPDTLDTWFSSGLWTFSTLGWPEMTDDLKTYHPNTVLETGYDILFFWVARMILMSTYLLGEIPFRAVYLHGLVRDEKGQKMSKSLGNIIDPLDMIDKYGADAVRLSLIIGTGPGNDSKLSEERVRGYKHFANKVWNAGRFVLSNTEDFDWDEDKRPELTESDWKRAAEAETLTKEITGLIEEYRFYLAAEKLYHYFWHTFADIIIEESKPILSKGSANEKLSAQWTLLFLLERLLVLLHPFTPFVTEEIWSSLPKKKHPLMMESWPLK